MPPSTEDLLFFLHEQLSWGEVQRAKGSDCEGVQDKLNILLILVHPTLWI